MHSGCFLHHAVSAQIHGVFSSVITVVLRSRTSSSRRSASVLGLVAAAEDRRRCSGWLPRRKIGVGARVGCRGDAASAGIEFGCLADPAPTCGHDLLKFLWCCAVVMSGGSSGWHIAVVELNLDGPNVRMSNTHTHTSHPHVCFVCFWTWIRHSGCTHGDLQVSHVNAPLLMSHFVVPLRISSCLWAASVCCGTQSRASCMHVHRHKRV